MHDGVMRGTMTLSYTKRPKRAFVLFCSNGGTHSEVLTGLVLTQILNFI